METERPTAKPLHYRLVPFVNFAAVLLVGVFVLERNFVGMMIVATLAAIATEAWAEFVWQRWGS